MAEADPKTLRHFSREMGITHAEFIRSLPPAVQGYAYTVSGDTITVDGPQGPIVIRLGPQGERQIGLLRLPQTRVDFAFDDYAGETIHKFMSRFDLAFRRGGG